MLKKAGIVVLGTAAGVMSLSSVAFAGQMPDSSDSDGGSGHHHQSRECSNDKIAYSSGGNLVDLSNLASNLDVSHLNILAADSSVNHGCSGHGGDKAAISGGHNLIDGSNLLSNADLSHLNVLASDSSENG